jgi:hypothetical protein
MVTRFLGKEIDFGDCNDWGSDFDLAHADTDKGADNAGDCSESHESAEHEKYAVHPDIPLCVN